MKRRTVLAVLRCLQVSGESEPAVHGLEAIREGAWRQAIPWLDSSGLALYFRHRILNSDFGQTLPSFVHDHLHKAEADQFLRLQAVTEEFRFLNELLASLGVSYAALKGFSLVPEYSPDPMRRVQYDHDFLIAPEGLERVDAALRSVGYVRKDKPDDHAALYVPQSMRIPAGRINPYSARLARPVELHWGLWDGRQENIRLAVPEGVLDRIEWRGYEGIRFPALGADDALLFQVLHAFRHLLHNWCRLAVFLELSRFLKRREGDRASWQSYCARLKGRAYLAEISGMVFQMAHCLFGAPVPQELSARPESELAAVLRLWAKEYGVSSAFENFRGNKFSLFLHREFVAGTRAWRTICRRRLFPLQRPNRIPSPSRAGVMARALSVARSLGHTLGRIRHHLFQALQYAWELPRWRRRRAEAVWESMRTSDSPVAAALRRRPADGRRELAPSSGELAAPTEQSHPRPRSEVVD